MEISVKSFNLRNTGYRSGDSFKVQNVECYVPFHQNLYIVNVKVNLDEKVGSFKFVIGLQDWISQKERRESIEGLLDDINYMESLDELKVWIKELKKKINNNWIENHQEYR